LLVSYKQILSLVIDELVSLLSYSNGTSKGTVSTVSIVDERGRIGGHDEANEQDLRSGSRGEPTERVSASESTRRYIVVPFCSV